MTLEDVASPLAQAFGRKLSVDDMLELAFDGTLKICAVIPGWKSTGVGELAFFTAEGGSIGSITDGIFRHLSKYDFQMLQTHRRLALAGRQVELSDHAGNALEVFIGPDAPEITIDDLRIAATEINRFAGDAAVDHEAGDKKKNAPVGWLRVAQENIEKIRPVKGGKASARGVMRWLKKNGPRDVIPEDQPKDQELIWLMFDGTKKKVTLSTIGNNLRRINQGCHGSA